MRSVVMPSVENVGKVCKYIAIAAATSLAILCICDSPINNEKLMIIGALVAITCIAVENSSTDIHIDIQ